MPERILDPVCGLQSHRQLPANSYGERLHYTWTIYRSVVKVRTCSIERQLQTAVNNILKWCDTNGHSISASKSCCVHFCRKRGIHPDPEIRIRDIQIPVVPDVRFLE
ncbi:RNase H domain-containing protein [Trichonephila clavipes]|nr:RNase H domain-containing protein [Trichonephila clavipes]